MTKIAIASTDGISIDEHFGRAGEFFIYEVEENGTYQLLERRKNMPYCPDGEAHSNAKATAELLSDVKVVLAGQIGPNAAGILESSGIISFALTGSIDKALRAYGKRSKLIKNITGSFSGNCRSSGCGCPGGCYE